ncbi:MAG TPA: polyphosphate kinase 2 family protein [Ignavibacteria bacterium]|nr:polyphosphate kinase 2 family protein [Ignavibacteria bacterium]HQY51413.1 polyphosphate kinase 2 family protein [Ignavibacteria bacterium]HRA99257.1 polyphosphate kinase 2 family protein [Ignavibacteria bacterium]
MLKEFDIDINKYFAKPDKKVDLSKWDTEYKGDKLDKESSLEILESGKEKLSAIQDVLYADNKYSVLIIFQAMDAAGKDGSIKHIMSGFNPQGVIVHSYKAPNTLELEHDYLWRHYIDLPRAGNITIFNRSHYENVLVTRVHPEYVMNEKIPGINSVKDIDDNFWSQRFEQINHFEKTVRQNGTVIIKFYLHLSKEEQKKRFFKRIDKPEKNWKFSMNDVNERKYWDDYQKAYEEAISNTSKENSPWYIIPADNKWYTRILITAVIHKYLSNLDLKYPEVNEDMKKELISAKEELLKE